MQRSVLRVATAVACVAGVGLGVRIMAKGPKADFGLFIADQLRAHAEQLFGFTRPLDESAIGPFSGPSMEALDLARGLGRRSCRARSTIRPTRSRSGPTMTIRRICSSATRRARIRPSSASNLSAARRFERDDHRHGSSTCDPVRRTPWGTIIVAEEAGSTGGFYEIIDPARASTSPIAVTNRAAGTTSDPAHLVKRKAVGSLSFESFAHQGRRHDDLRRRTRAERRRRRRRHLQVRAARRRSRRRPDLRCRVRVTVRERHGLRPARRRGRLDQLGPGRGDGQGPVGRRQYRRRAASWTPTATSSCEPRRHCRDSPATTGPRTWTSIRSRSPNDVVRVCWANTGRVSHAGGSTVENSAVYAARSCA